MDAMVVDAVEELLAGEWDGSADSFEDDMLEVRNETGSGGGSNTTKC
ncbi:hypothetical protein [Streptomyces sp. NPDC004658]